MGLFLSDEAREKFKIDHPVLFGLHGLRQYKERPCCANCIYLKASGQHTDDYGFTSFDYTCGMVPEDKYPLSILGLDEIVCDKHEPDKQG